MTVTASDQDVIVGVCPEYLTEVDPAPDAFAVHATITEHLGQADTVERRTGPSAA